MRDKIPFLSPLYDKNPIFEINKKKKEGVFYTPPQIAAYIVEETIGSWLEDCKLKLGYSTLPTLSQQNFLTPDYSLLKKDKSMYSLQDEINSQDKVRQQHRAFWKALKKRIQRIKVLDPACGPGVFLHQVMCYLSAMERKIDEEIEKLSPLNSHLKKFTPHSLISSIFGVDIDPQVIPLARYELLKQIHPHTRRYHLLDHNIKSGNSLIDDPQIAPQSAFDWEKEYPEILNNGGFDIIIGNPPWVFAREGKFDPISKEYLYRNYRLSDYQLNTYPLFIEKSFQLLKDYGYLGFIIPNTWLTIHRFSRLREFILENTTHTKIINIYGKIFEQARVDSSILILKKNTSSKDKENRRITLGEMKNGETHIIGEFHPLQFKSRLSTINFSFLKNPTVHQVMQEINNHSRPLSEIARVSTGVKVYQTGKGNPPQTRETGAKRLFHSHQPLGISYKKYLEGKNVGRYTLIWSCEYVNYGEWIAEPRKSVDFSAPRILVRQIPSKPPYCINSVFTTLEYINDINSMVVLDFKESPLFILACLNSRIISSWFIHRFDKHQRKLFPQFKVGELANFPIPFANTQQIKSLETKVLQIIELKKSSSVQVSQNIQQEMELLDKAIDQEVNHLYRLTPGETFNRFIEY